MTNVQSKAQITSREGLAQAMAAAKQGHDDEAHRLYVERLSRHPNDPVALTNVAAILGRRQHYESAVAAYARAIEADSNLPIFWANLGNALVASGRIDDALLAHRRAIELSSEPSSVILFNYAQSLSAAGQWELALETCRRVLTLSPDHLDAKSNLAHLLLQLGDWPEGLRTLHASQSPLQALSVPRWLGEEFADKVLFLHELPNAAEIIPFLRFVAAAKKRGGQIVLEAPPEMKNLVEQCPEIDQVVVRGETLPDIDLECPLAVLPLALDQTVAPSENSEPYLSFPPPPPGVLEKLAALGRRRAIGIIWAPEDLPLTKNSSAELLDQFLRLAEIPDVALFSLQTGASAEALHRPGIAALVTDLVGTNADFLDIGSALTALDLVVVRDTAVAHLAGALGVPTWFLREGDISWPWMSASGTAPWYPTVRTITCKSGASWDDIFDQVCKEARSSLSLGHKNGDDNGPIQPSVDPDAPLIAQAQHAANEGRFDEALRRFAAVIENTPDHIAALTGLADAFRSKGLDHCAIAAYRRILSLNPKILVIWSDLGIALYNLGRFDESLAAHHTAADLSHRRDPALLFNLAVAQRVSGELESALDNLREVLELDPENAVARFHESLLLLHLERWPSAWQAYESRLDLPNRKESSSFGKPRWRGEMFRGKTLLLFHEQGFGDAIQFVRYAQLAKARGGEILMLTPPELARIFQAVPGIDQVVVSGAPYPEFDFECPLLSLPAIFETHLDTIPPPAPFTAAALSREIRDRLDPVSDRFKVGIVWSGNVNFSSNQFRAAPLAQFLSLAEVPGTALISLQKGPPVEAIAAIGADVVVTDCGKYLGDFDDTVSLIQELDLVIATDTSVAHLAGSMDVPVWLLLHRGADWRWLRDRNDSPWYPSMRLFRQTHPGNWEDVFQRVKTALAELVGRPAVTSEAFSVNARQRQLVATKPPPDTTIAPDEPVIQRALVAQREGRLEEAGRGFDTWLATHPNDSAAFINFGAVLLKQRKYQAAIAAYRRALEINPESVAGWTSLGNALNDAGRFEESLAAHQEALARSDKIEPRDKEVVHYNHASTLTALGRTDEALQEFRRVVALNPQHYEAKFKVAALLLLKGEFKAGWPAYEVRWHVPPLEPRKFTTPRWNGAPFKSKTLLLHDEQGYGDSIQFIRFAARVKERGGRVILQTRRPLARLLASTSGIDAIVVRDQPIPAHDLECPVMSLPGVFGIDMADLPGQIPYLFSPKLAGKLAGPLAQLANRFKVGIVWAGNPEHNNDHNRSAPLEYFLQLLETPGVSLISLQKGSALQELMAQQIGSIVIDLGSHLNDFADTSALISELDLVICVDTAVAHLAGALGRPVWILLPFVGEWRWLKDRDDSPWYPSARLFRQRTPGNWQEVFERVHAALVNEASQRSTAQEDTAPTATVGFGDLDLYAQAQTAENAADDEKALQLYTKWLHERPDDIRALGNIGNILRRQNKLATASASYLRALEVDPKNPALWSALGSALSFQGRYASAIAAKDCAIELAPKQSPILFHNRSITLRDAGLFDKALRDAEKALTIDPQYSEAQFHRAVLLLLRGDFEMGWPAYESRWKMERFNKRTFHKPRWQGEPFPGKTLLLHCEQGFGDAIQFIRFAKIAKARGGRVIVGGPKPLQKLLRTVEGVDDVVIAGDTLPHFDLESALLSLPGILGVAPGSFADAVPYIKADKAPKNVAAEIAKNGRPLKIGIAWAGRPTHRNDRNRSTSLAHFLKLLEIRGVQLVSLQKGESEKEIEALGVSEFIANPMPFVDDFADTAAVINQLDLVISVDTAVAHLAAAMGKPTWILLPKVPDWRWLLDRETSPWYPDVRLFRATTHGDWHGVFERVESAVHELTGNDASGVVQTEPQPISNPARSELDKILQTEGGEGLAGAIEHCAQLLHKHVGDPAILRALGRLLLEDNRANAAVIAFSWAIERVEDDPQAWLGLGTALYATNRYSDALSAFDRAEALHTHDKSELLFQRALALRSAGQLAEAEATTQQILAHTPDNLAADRLEAALELQQGRWGDDWSLVERCASPPSLSVHTDYDRPRWQGENLSGKSLLLESGPDICDTFMFARFVSLIGAGRDKVVLKAPPSATRLCLSVPGVDRVIAEDDPVPQTDFWCPLSAVPGTLGLPLGEIPAATPYMTAPETPKEILQALNVPPGRMRIGILWGTPHNEKNQPIKEIGLDYFLSLLQIAGIELVSLQADSHRHDIEALSASHLVCDIGQFCADLADSAAAMTQLNLMICSDCPEAHLAGALGAPVWVLLPRVGSWRWPGDGQNSPWYETARVFRQQENGDWGSVFADVRSALNAVLKKGSRKLGK